MTDYTPTVEEFREWLRSVAGTAEFDRMLAEVIRAAREEGYNHGATDMQAEANGAGYAMNPYRKEPSGG